MVLPMRELIHSNPLNFQRRIKKKNSEIADEKMGAKIVKRTNRTYPLPLSTLVTVFLIAKN